MKDLNRQVRQERQVKEQRRVFVILGALGVLGGSIRRLSSPAIMMGPAMTDPKTRTFAPICGTKELPGGLGALQRELQSLRRAGLVGVRREGGKMFYQPVSGMPPVAELLNVVWRLQFQMAAGGTRRRRKAVKASMRKM